MKYNHSEGWILKNKIVISNFSSFVLEEKKKKKKKEKKKTEIHQSIH
jgi:hypothetical protein